MDKNQDSLFNEAFKLITTNKSKANSLRQSLIENDKNDENNNLKTIQYLGEFEYDLKTLYDILRDLKLLYNEMNNKNHIINKNIEGKFNKIGIDSNNNNKSKKVRIHLQNDFDIYDNKYDGISKTYSMTTSQFDNNQKRSNISDHYINSYPRKNQYNKRLHRSMTCKSYIGNWKSNPFEFLDNDINIYTKKDLEYKKYNDNKFPDNILSNHKFLESKYFRNDNSNTNISKDKTLKLNFDYDAYLTDYSLNKTYKNDLNNTGDNNNDNLNNLPNLNLSDLKNENNVNNGNNENKIVNSNAFNPSNSIKNSNTNLNKDSIIPNKNDNNKNENNNLFTFAQPKNNSQNLNDYIVTFDPKKLSNEINKNNINNNEEHNNEEYNNEDNNNEDINNKNNYENKINNKYNFTDLNKNKYQINDQNNLDNNLDYNIYDNILNKNKINNNNYFKDLNEEIHQNNDINYKDNNINNQNNNLDINKIENVNYLNNEDNLNDDNNYNNIENNNENEDEDLEMEKKEIIKNIISEIFQDPKKLDLLKKELGNDIGHKLLSGNVTEEQLYKIAEILKNYQLNNFGPKKNYKHFTTKKYNQPSDKILLRESLDNKRYNYREYPRGWNSTKDYFVNNGTTFIKDNRRKKY